MATFSGYVLDQPIPAPNPADKYPNWYLAGWDTGWDTFWDGNPSSFTSWGTEWDTDWGTIKTGWLFLSGQVVNMPTPIYGAYADNQPYITTSRNIVGYMTPKYSDIFYNRILIEPLFVDFGSLTGNVQGAITVWNAYFVPAELQTIQENGFGTGLVFSGEILPKTYQPLEEIGYTIDANLNGPPVIDSTLVFTFVDPELSVNTVSFTGSRIVFFPTMYLSGMVESLEWDTDVMESYNGTEQRARNRTAPRQFMQIGGCICVSAAKNFENLLYGWRGRFWAIPVWQDARIGSNIVAGSSTINVDTRFGDFRENSLVGIWQNQMDFDIATAIIITDDSISFDRSINSDFTSPFIFPVRLARMTAAPIRNTNGYSSIVETKMQVTDNVELETEPSPEQYLGEDVFLEVPETASGNTVADGYETRVDLIDFSTGNIEQVTPWDNLKLNRSFTLLKEGLEDIWNFRLWLHRRAGKLRPFWMPTFESNMKVLDTTFIADNFYIEPDSYAAQASTRNHIIVFMKDGSHIITEILNIDTADATKTRIAVSPDLNVEGSDISYVSFIGLKRLSSDKISIRWYSNNVANFTVPIKEITP